MLKFGAMAKKKKKQTKSKTERPLRTSLPIPTLAVLALVVPLVAGLFVGVVTGGLNSTTNGAPMLGAVGLASWFLGLFWYGLPALGLRGKRPLFAGIGFATLGWVTFLVLRGLLIPIDLENAGSESLRSFVYLLLFEGFALQLWTFGLLFRALSDWRGALTAAVVSGLLFGGVLFVFSPYTFNPGLITLIYYILLGVFYGIIRLRTGSLLGIVPIYALQLFTAWVALGPPPPETAVSQFNWTFTLAALACLLFTWRLWPKEESDYRV